MSILIQPHQAACNAQYGPFIYLWLLVPHTDIGRTAYCWYQPLTLNSLRCELEGGEEGLDQNRPPLAQNQLDTQRPLVTETVKRAAISMARDSWEVYFSRLFPAMVRVPSHPCLPAQSSQG